MVDWTRFLPPLLEGQQRIWYEKDSIKLDHFFQKVKGAASDNYYDV